MSTYSNYLGSKKCCGTNLTKTGSIGQQGSPGSPGPIGPYGYQGATGNQGLRGATGLCCRGPQGVQGAQGTAGGAQGVTGEQGSTGVQGDTGATGAQGFQGATGAAGINGISSGLVLYLDGPTTSTVPVSDDLLVIPNTGAQTIITTSSITNSSSILVGNFVTPVGLLTTTSIIGGFWNTLLYGQSSGVGGNVVYWTLINEVASDGTTFIKNLSTGTYASGTVVQTTQSIYEYSLYVAINTITNLNSRIQLQIYTQASGGTHTLYLEMRDNTLSYIVTTIATNLIGFTGVQGATGRTGAQGFQGVTGAQGFTGTTGAQGFTGTTGAQGFQGVTGRTGSTGAQGSTGATGTQGFQGFTGTTGAQGFQGVTGSTGAQGSTGATGAQGSTGLQGFQGVIGAQGSTGSQGINGISSGLILFLDGPTTSTVPVSDNLLVIPNTGTQTIITTSSIGTSPILVGNFVTPAGLLTTTSIIGGFWNTELYALSTGGGGNTVYWTVINEVASDGTTFIKNLSTGTYASGTVVQTTQSIYEYSLYVATNTITNLNSRIQLQIYTRASGGTHTLSLEMRGNTLSHIVTTIATNIGATGVQGATGITGAQGFQGTTGARGVTGIQGATGAGATGPQGAQGTAGGAQGATGITGPQGAQGTAGGAQGATGRTGSQGSTGTTGAQGFQGATGSGGILGYYGAFGTTANLNITTAGDTAFFSGFYIDGAGNNGVNIITTTSSNDTFRMVNPGVYNIQFSAQIVITSGGGGSNAYIWLEQQGTTVPWSNTNVQLSSSNAPQVAAWNFFIKTTTPNETFRLVWTADNNNMQIVSYPPGPPPGSTNPYRGPNIPGVLLTVNQIA